MTPTTITLLILLVVNMVTFMVVAHDKHKAMKRGEVERTPEGLIFFSAAAFGALGAYLAMIIFRHKTRKWYFQIGIPLLIIQNIATLYCLALLWPSVSLYFS